MFYSPKTIPQENVPVLLGQIWPSLNKDYTNYNESLGHFLPSFLPTCSGLDLKPLAPDPASLCSLHGSLLHSCLFLGYQQQSIWQEFQYPALPVNTEGDRNAHQLVGFGPFRAGLFFTASKQDFHGFQVRQGFAYIGKNK